MHWKSPGKMRTKAVRNGCEGTNTARCSFWGLIVVCVPIDSQAFQATFQTKSSKPPVSPFDSAFVPHRGAVDKMSWNALSAARETYKNEKHVLVPTEILPPKLMNSLYLRVLAQCRHFDVFYQEDPSSRKFFKRLEHDPFCLKNTRYSGQAQDLNKRTWILITFGRENKLCHTYLRLRPLFLGGVAWMMN